MTDETAQATTADEPQPQLSESELRRMASYQKHRLVVVGSFLIAIVVCGLSFKPLGDAFGAVATSIYDAMVSSGTAGQSAGLSVMLGANAVGWVFVLLMSLYVGPRVPSGFPHVVLGIIVPLTLAATQATLFRLTDGAGGLVDTEFARWSFVVMFVITLLTVESGVQLGRRRLEKRAA